MCVCVCVCIACTKTRARTHKCGVRSGDSRPFARYLTGLGHGHGGFVTPVTRTIPQIERLHDGIVIDGVVTGGLTNRFRFARNARLMNRKKRPLPRLINVFGQNTSELHRFSANDYTCARVKRVDNLKKKSFSPHAGHVAVTHTHTHVHQRRVKRNIRYTNSLQRTKGPAVKSTLRETRGNNNIIIT